MVTHLSPNRKWMIQLVYWLVSLTLTLILPGKCSICFSDYVNITSTLLTKFPCMCCSSVHIRSGAVSLDMFQHMGFQLLHCWLIHPDVCFLSLDCLSVKFSSFFFNIYANFSYLLCYSLFQDTVIAGVVGNDYHHVFRAADPGALPVHDQNAGI